MRELQNKMKKNYPDVRKIFFMHCTKNIKRNGKK